MTRARSGLLHYEVDVPLHRLVRLVGEDHAVRSYRACPAALGTIARIDWRLGGGNGFHRTESLQGSSRAAHVSGLRREWELRRRYGFDVEWWSDTRKMVG